MVWGSSFILMKLGLYANGKTQVLNPFQVAALRIFSAGIVLLLFFFKAAKKIPSKALGYIFLSGLLGNFLPAFLFCIAESRIDSSLTAMLNTLTPICALLTGILVYRSKATFNQWMGVLTGLTGCILLFEGKSTLLPGEIWYALMVIAATVCYGVNVNLVRHKLYFLASIHIAAMAFTMLLIPSALVLYVTGFFRLPLSDASHFIAVSSTSVLGTIGTALATVAIYRLVQKGGAVFASMVTYGIPFVAIFWGFIYGESIGIVQVVGLMVILAGVFMAGRLRA
jgi:drug/metabolite transporter (DMT)-like permease